MHDQEFLDLIKEFEKRNNISVVVQLCSDGSGTIFEFWDESELEQFNSLDHLVHILEFVSYRKENGLCVHPVERALI